MQEYHSIECISLWWDEGTMGSILAWKSASLFSQLLRERAIYIPFIFIAYEGWAMYMNTHKPLLKEESFGGSFYASVSMQNFNLDVTWFIFKHRLT